MLILCFVMSSGPAFLPCTLASFVCRSPTPNFLISMHALFCLFLRLDDNCVKTVSFLAAGFNPPSPVPFELLAEGPHIPPETVSGCNQKMMATNGVWHRIYSIDPCTIFFRNLLQTVVTMICKHFLLQKKTFLVSVPPFSEKNLSLCLKNTTKVRRDSCHIRNVSIKRPLPTGHEFHLAK